MLVRSLRFVSSIIAILVLIISPAQLNAQKKDSLRLACLLQNATEHKEKAAMSLGEEDPKIILSSATDSLVKAPTDAVISTIRKDEEGKWEVVFYKKDYWFWLTGISRVVVKKDQRVKTGDAIGILAPGEKIELLLYDFETPLDPKQYMQCPGN
jgi:hypothetical protein